MKKFNNSIFKITNWLLTGFLTLLGFACSDENREDGGTVEEYGTPYATYEIKGKVINENESPIPNIEIQSESRMGYSDTSIYKPITPDSEKNVKTNQDGNFTAQYGAFPTDTIRIIAIDGSSNNSFLNDTIKIGLKNEDYTGGNKWYKGAVKKDITIKMKRKNNE